MRATRVSERELLASISELYDGAPAVKLKGEG